MPLVAHRLNAVLLILALLAGAPAVSAGQGPPSRKTALTAKPGKNTPTSPPRKTKNDDDDDDWPDDKKKTKVVLPTRPKSGGIQARVGGYYEFRLALDTSHENGFEDIMDVRNILDIFVNVQFAKRAKIYIGGRMVYRNVCERREDTTFFLFNGENYKHQFEVEPREMYLDFYTKFGLDIRAGYQIFAWGANDTLAPGDVLNPMDIRDGFAQDPSKQPKIPVFALKLNYRFSKFNITAAWIPFYSPHKAYIYGHDFALVQPSVILPLAAYLATIDPALEDAIQDDFLKAHTPDEDILNSQAAIRFWGTQGGVDFGLSYAFLWERLPYAMLDPELGKLLYLGFQENPDYRQLAFLANNVLQRVQRMEPLYLITYKRQHVISADMSTSLGPLILKADVGIVPQMTLYGQNHFLPTVYPFRKPVLTYSVGLDYRYQEDFFVLVQWYHMIVLNMKEGESLFMVKEHVTMILFMLRLVLLDEKLEIGISGMGGISQRDLVLGPYVKYKFNSHWSLTLGGNILEGRKQSIGGYFDHHDQVYLSLKYTL